MPQDTLNSTWILAVDDEPSVLSFLTRALRRFGYRVEAASSARDAEELLLADPYRFGMVILDLTLPDMPGDHLLARLRAERPALPVLLISGRPWSGPSGPRTRFMTKPFGLLDFLEQVRGLLAVASPSALDHARP